MAAHGRMIFCGFISAYNGDIDPDPLDMTTIIRRRLMLKGFTMPDHYASYPMLFSELGKLMMQGKLKYRLHVEEGLENAPVVFNKLFDGSNTGKLVVKVSDL
jgi:NADPH-dependent curcumin reductase CurA